MITSKNLTVNKKGELVYITFPKFEKDGGVKCVFTTRLGGVSVGQYESMNMSMSNGDNTENVIKNYRIICDAVGFNFNNLVLSHQTHTDNLMTVNEKDVGKGIFKERDYDNIDGLITNIKGIPLVTQFADCTPLLFYDKEKKVIAASHGGWRGTAKEIGLKTVRKMQNEFGCNPKDIICGIGPSVCKKCYEVDTPVYNEFKKIEYLNFQKVIEQTGENKYHLDLWEANREILVYAGIKPENIDVTDLCTSCNNSVFHSHRVNGWKRGNLAAIIQLV